MSDLLVDTQAMTRLVEGQRELPAAACRRFEDGAGRRLFSVASLWEMAIKMNIGKLTLTSGSIQGFAEILTLHGAESLPVTSPEAMDVASLPADRHHDPFDRLIAAQCLRHGLPLLSIDAAFDAYGVERVWSR